MEKEELFKIVTSNKFNELQEKQIKLADKLDRNLKNLLKLSNKHEETSLTEEEVTSYLNKLKREFLGLLRSASSLLTLSRQLLESANSESENNTNDKNA